MLKPGDVTPLFSLLEIAIAKGKRQYDKRRAMIERELDMAARLGLVGRLDQFKINTDKILAKQQAISAAVAIVTSIMVLHFLPRVPWGRRLMLETELAAKQGYASTAEGDLSREEAVADLELDEWAGRDLRNPRNEVIDRVAAVVLGGELGRRAVTRRVQDLDGRSCHRSTQRQDGREQRHDEQPNKLLLHYCTPRLTANYRPRTGLRASLTSRS